MRELAGRARLGDFGNTSSWLEAEKHWDAGVGIEDILSPNGFPINVPVGVMRFDRGGNDVAESLWSVFQEMPTGPRKLQVASWILEAGIKGLRGDEPPDHTLSDDAISELLTIAPNTQVNLVALTLLRDLPKALLQRNLNIPREGTIPFAYYPGMTFYGGANNIASKVQVDLHTAYVSRPARIEFLIAALGYAFMSAPVMEMDEIPKEIAANQEMISLWMATKLLSGSAPRYSTEQACQMLLDGAKGTFIQDIMYRFRMGILISDYAEKVLANLQETFRLRGLQVTGIDDALGYNLAKRMSELGKPERWRALKLREIPGVFPK